MTQNWHDMDRDGQTAYVNREARRIAERVIGMARRSEKRIGASRTESIDIRIWKRVGEFLK